MKETFLPRFASEFGIERVDHVAVTTESMEETLGFYLGLPGAWLMRGPGWNPTQKVHYAFVTVADGLTVEILAPSGDSPIRSHIRSGAGPYHFCFSVADIGAALERARECGCTIVAPPQPDVAFDGRKVAFLAHRSLGLFEFVESRPAETTIPGRTSASAAPAGSVDEKILAVMTKLLKQGDPAKLRTSVMGETEHWDSLAHLHLMMELETEFDVRFSGAEIPRATNFEKIRAMVAEARARAKGRI